MIDTIANLFLTFTHETILIPLVVIGYIWLDKRIFFHATCLLLISMLCNYVLKITFQVPLSPLLNKPGFAFPSGHMQSALVFYGWLFLQSRLIYKGLIVALLSGVAVSLVHLGFHTYYDIAGAITAGVLLLAMYNFVLTNYPQKLSAIVLIFTTVLLIYTGIAAYIPAHVWMAYYGVLGLLLGTRVFAHKKMAIDTRGKIYATIICIASILIIKAIFATVIFDMPTSISQLQWGLIGFCIIAAPCVVGTYYKKTSLQ